MPECSDNSSSGKIHKKRSKNRREIESELASMGISVEKRITIINLDNAERYYFDDYIEALNFIKDKKGRWYMASPGIQYK